MNNGHINYCQGFVIDIGLWINIKEDARIYNKLDSIKYTNKDEITQETNEGRIITLVHDSQKFPRHE